MSTHPSIEFIADGITRGFMFDFRVYPIDGKFDVAVEVKNSEQIERIDRHIVYWVEPDAFEVIFRKPPPLS